MGKTFFGDYGFRILLVVFFLLSFIWMGTKRTLQSNSNNVADWLPESFVETQEYNWFLNFFPHESFVVVSWENCTMDDARLEMFAQKLVPGQRIDNMSEWMNNVNQLKVTLHLNEIPSIADPDSPDSSADKQKSGELTEKSVPGSEAANTLGVSGGITSDSSKPDVSLDAKKPNYFKHVLTGPRLKRMLEDKYGPDSQSPMSDAQILERLDGLLIGPHRTAPDGSPLPVEKYRTAMIVTLNKPANEKELRKVLTTIKEVGKECGVQPKTQIDNRPTAERVTGTVVTFLKDVFIGIPYKINGIVMGGPPVDNVAIGYEGERTLFRLAGICALVGLTISMLCFRSLRLTMFIFWTAILAAGIALAMVSLTGSRCDAIMLSMPALVYVLAMSGAIHIINYYHDTIRDHGLHGAVEIAVSHAWYPCFIASLTTAIGLGSLYFSHLIPIMKFGFYSAIGVLMTLLLLFLYLPSLLHFFPSREYAKQMYKQGGEHGMELDNNQGIIANIWDFIGKNVIRFNIPVMIFFLGLMIYFTFGIFDIKTSVKMMRFYSPNAEIIAHYGELEEQLGPLVPMEIVVRFDNKRCPFNTLERLRFIQKISNELREKLPEDIGGIMSAATLTPPTDGKGRGRPGSGSLRTFEYALNGRLDRHRTEMADVVAIEGNPSFEEPKQDEYVIFEETLSQLEMTRSDFEKFRAVGINSLKELLATRDGLTLPGITAEQLSEYRDKAKKWQKQYGTDLWRISLRVWSLKKDIDYALFINDVKNIVNPMIDEFVVKHFPNETFPKHVPVGVSDKKQILGTIGEWYDGKIKMVYSLLGWTKPVISEDTYPVSAIYTGMVPVVYKTQHELIAGLVDSLISAFVLIAIVMAFVLRSPTAGLLAMIPNLFPVVIVFGFMGHLGILVDVGTIMTASVAMGIAVDDTMHYLTWFRSAIDHGYKPKEAAMHAYQKCATAMTQTTLIGGVGLSAFAFSTFTPTQMFGVMMLCMLFVALIGDLIFLPAILTGPAGRFFLPKHKTMLDLPADIADDFEPTPQLRIVGETKHVG
ncbi:MAG: efflux RND transporter permease subunit [Thermoguttaceae bacterium]